MKLDNSLLKNSKNFFSLTLELILIMSMLGNAGSKNLDLAYKNTLSNTLKRAIELHSNIPQAPPIKLNVKKSNFSHPAFYKENPSNNNLNLPTLEEINHQGNTNLSSKRVEEKHSNIPQPPLMKSTFKNNLNFTLAKDNYNSNKNSDLPTLDEINKHQSKIDDVSKRTEDKSGFNKIKSNSDLPRTTTVYKPSASSSSGSSGGFFQNTSKNNQKSAWKALGAFVMGFILFFISIQVICWNERRAVKFSNFIDWVEDPNNSLFLGRKNLNGEKPADKAYIVQGGLRVTEEARVTISNLEQIENKIRSKSGGKILYIKIKSESWKIISQNQTDVVRVDQNGNEEDQVQIEEDWREISKSDTLPLNSEFLNGKATLDSVYEFELSRLEYLINSNTYSPTREDIPIFEEYVKNRSGGTPKILIENNYIYVIHDLREDSVFNSETHNYIERDRRISIQYFAPKDDEKIITLAGKLTMLEGNMYKVTEFKTPIKHAEYSCYLCCCGETNESYTVDLVEEGEKTKEDIINMYRDGNKACTFCMRIFGFLLHFTAYYLILYPLILLIGMIPFIGAIGAFVLILFAFLFSLITFLFIIACAWIVARPLMAFFLFSLILVLIFLSKMSRDRFHNKDDQIMNQNDYMDGQINKMKFL